MLSCQGFHIILYWLHVHKFSSGYAVVTIEGTNGAVETVDHICKVPPFPKRLGIQHNVLSAVFRISSIEQLL